MIFLSVFVKIEKFNHNSFDIKSDVLNFDFNENKLEIVCSEEIFSIQHKFSVESFCSNFCAYFNFSYLREILI